LLLGQKMNHSRSNLSRLILIEAPVARLPLAVLFIDILHNGAVAFYVYGTLGRLLANIFIWIVLVVGGGVVIFFRDWYYPDPQLTEADGKRVFGLAIAYHMLSLAIEQLEIKFIALQWIFGMSTITCESDASSVRHLRGHRATFCSCDDPTHETSY